MKSSIYKITAFLMERKKIIFASFLFFIIALIVFIIIANILVISAAKNRTFSDVKSISKNRVGLLLGTSKWDRYGRLNLYFKYRVEAAVKLYNAKKIDYILVSGDNRTKNYNEPIELKNELLKRGVPEEKIFLDYAGFRTLDSVVRAKEVFGQDTITIISQHFHNSRAIFLARYKGIEAIGFNAKDVPISRGIPVKVREVFARTKALWDIITGVGPKFLGEKITIE